MPKIITDSSVFAAVIEVISQNGYSGATTRQIAQAANINEVTLFRKYGNKAQLVVNTFEYIASQLDVASKVVYTGELEADLQRIVTVFYDTNDMRSSLMPILLAELPRHPELEEALSIPMRILERVGEILARYQAEGALIAEHPLQAVGALMGPLMVGLMLGKFTAELPPPDMEAHVATFLNGRRASD